MQATPSKVTKKILRSDGTYLLIGGTGGLGRSMAKWMVDNGAGNVVLLSRSGLSRLVDRLEREGLVERRACPSDARGTFAVLTEAGRSRLREASGTHLRGVARHVLSHFSPEEQDLLGDLLSRLGGPVGPPRVGQGCGSGV